MTCRAALAVGSVILGSLLSLGPVLLPSVNWRALGNDATRPATPRASSLSRLADALRRSDIGAADRAWRAAYVEAMRAQAWSPLADLGDAAMQIVDRGGQRARYVPLAREAYVAALVRARAARSVEGVSRVCRAFMALGDHDVAQQCAIIADTLSARRLGEAPSGRAAAASRDPEQAP
jgi:hypothetical protein